MVKLLNTKLEYGRLSVKFMGAKIFNDLSLCRLGNNPLIKVLSQI